MYSVSWICLWFLHVTNLKFYDVSEPIGGHNLVLMTAQYSLHDII